MNVMADPNAGPTPSGLPTARTFPDAVPILVDAKARSQASRSRQRRSPRDSGTVPRSRDDPVDYGSYPPDGYQLGDAEEFLALTAAGCTTGERLGWTIEAQRGAERGFCGSIDLRLEGDGVAEVGFGLHPEARGRSVMSTALHLVCAYGFEEIGLEVIRWRALVGNWASRRVAARVGFISMARSGDC
jgi:RimJ/RimL family protein N-acetyltransferase